MYVCMYVYMYVCMNTYMYVCMHVYVSVCMYICIFVCLSVYMYIGMYVRQSLDTLAFHLRNRNCQADFFGVNVLQTNFIFPMLRCFNLPLSRVDFA